MRRTTRYAVAVAALTLLPMLAACAPETAPEPPEALTVSGAGAVYLASVCPTNDAWDLADVEVDRLRLAVARGQTDADTTAFADAMRAVARADERASARLGSKRQTWPADTEEAIEAVVASLDAERNQAKRVAKFDASEVAEYVWKGAEESSQASAAARAALQLPEDASAACRNWAEQEAERASEQDAEHHAEREAEHG